MTFNGYFGFQQNSRILYEMYPQGGFCEYMSAPNYAIVKLPDSVSFRERRGSDTGARPIPR